MKPLIPFVPSSLWTLLFCLAVIPITRGEFVARSLEPRARDLGIPLDGTPGSWNAITDVPGVWVGHTTLIEGDGDLKVGQGPIRTGVTAILPSGNQFQPVFAAVSFLNGNGEMTGTTWIEESGFLEEPILLTNTHSVGAVHDAVIRWRQKAHYHDGATNSFSWASLPVVAETWDGRLNDIHGFHVQAHHVFQALDQARPGPVPEGNVGGGTGMVCHRFKGGIGTASRRLPPDQGGYTLGILVQANYGLREDLTIAGVPVGRHLTNNLPEIHSIEPIHEGNSIIAILATDAPLLPHQLHRLTKRIPLGLARMGGHGFNSSGDLFLAFSTAHPIPSPQNDGLQETRFLANDQIDPLLAATVQATEEAILNALIAAKTMIGINGNTIYALPQDDLIRCLRTYGRLSTPPQKY